MLFNSFPFLFVFLPVTLAGFFALQAAGRSRAARVWLLVASAGFYAYWKPPYVLLLLLSIVFNYSMAKALYRVRLTGDLRQSKRLLIARVAVNLAVLGYFKYSGFLASIVNQVFGTSWIVHASVLPLGISFYTFTEIAYLVDIYQLKAVPGKFLDYCLFVTFFPHLIAGPIVHYRQLMPQFDDRRRSLLSDMAAAGAMVFILGLFKKVVIADGVAAFASPMFDTLLPSGVIPSVLPAWGAALAYTFQLYFDFSGYSDMAIGLAMLFSIRFPYNFDSPYKATSVIDFWRRWHMTLSAFLRDYLYVPLGGNRKGGIRRYVNLLITMVLGGLWHGAGWTFVFWGFLHGVYLTINHGWRALVARLNSGGPPKPRFVTSWASRLLTFVCVVIGWVFFRSHSMGDAARLLRGMAGEGGFVLPRVLLQPLGGVALHLTHWGVRFDVLDVRYFAGLTEVAWLGTLLAISMLAPNTQQIVPGDRPIRARFFEWTPSRRWALGGALAFTAALAFLAANRASEFLYFDF